MKPRTVDPDTPGRIVLELTDLQGQPIEGRDLQGVRIATDDGIATETTWQPDPGELKALVNGAPLHLAVWGDGHPPVSLAVGEPDMDTAVALLSRNHVERALASLWDALAERVGPRIDAWDQIDLDADGFREMFEQAIVATAPEAG